MKVKLIMYIEGDEYVYGTYSFNTPEEKNKVNELAMRIREERDCYTYIEKVEG
jgi:hypothetical protein